MRFSFHHRKIIINFFGGQKQQGWGSKGGVQWAPKQQKHQRIIESNKATTANNSISSTSRDTRPLKAGVLWNFGGVFDAFLEITIGS